MVSTLHLLPLTSCGKNVAIASVVYISRSVFQPRLRVVWMRRSTLLSAITESRASTHGLQHATNDVYAPN